MLKRKNYSEDDGKQVKRHPENGSIYRDIERGFNVQKNAKQKFIRGCFKQHLMV